jgi:hypothetical protein
MLNIYTWKQHDTGHRTDQTSRQRRRLSYDSNDCKRLTFQSAISGHQLQRGFDSKTDLSTVIWQVAWACYDIAMNSNIVEGCSVRLYRHKVRKGVITGRERKRFVRRAALTTLLKAKNVASSVLWGNCILVPFIKQKAGWGGGGPNDNALPGFLMQWIIVPSLFLRAETLRSVTSMHVQH